MEEWQYWDLKNTVDRLERENKSLRNEISSLDHRLQNFMHDIKFELNHKIDDIRYHSHDI